MPRGLQGALIRGQDVPHPLLGLLGGLAIRHEVLDRHDERRVGDDPAPAALVGHQLGERTQAVFRERLVDDRRKALDLSLARGPRRSVGLQLRAHLLDVEAVVPGVQHRRVSRLQHLLAVPVAGGDEQCPALLIGEPAVAAGDLEARHQPLDVPLEGAGVRLVEVVDVEDEPALRRAEQPEVREVRVTAELHREVAARGGGEIGGHQQRGTAVEREGRHHHASVPDRDELGDARRGLLLEQRDRVGALIARGPGGVARPGGAHAGRPAERATALEVGRGRLPQIGRGRLLAHRISSPRRDRRCTAPSARAACRRRWPQSVTVRHGRILSVSRRARVTEKG